MLKLKHFLHSHEGKLLLVVLALGIFFSFATRSFLSIQNMSNLLTSYAFSGMLAAGLLVVLIAGGIDISFTASASIAQYVAMTVANHYGIGWVGVIFIAGMVGITCGVINALLIGTLGLASIIVTIATLNVFFGLLMFITHGNQIFALPDWFVNGGSWVVYTNAQGDPFVVNLQMIGLIATFIITAILLNRTNIGRQIYALGSNAEAAKRVGIKVALLNLFVYGYMGLVAGMASLIQAQEAQSVSPNALVGHELDVLAAVVLGGASLTGGVGTVFGTILGVMLLAFLQNGLLLLGVQSYWLHFFTGAVILIAVSALALERQRHKASARRIMT